MFWGILKRLFSRGDHRFVDAAEECLLFTHSINDICVSKCNTTPTSKPNLNAALSFTNPTPAAKSESKSAHEAAAPAQTTPTSNPSDSTHSKSALSPAQSSLPQKQQPAAVASLSDAQHGERPNAAESSPKSSRKSSVSKPSRGRRRKNSKISKPDAEAKGDDDDAGEPPDPFPNIPAKGKLSGFWFSVVSLIENVF